MHLFYRRTFRERFIDGSLQQNLLAAPPGRVLCDDGDRLRVVDAVDERIGSESAEDDRMHGADSGAGEKSNGQFRHHAHIDGDAIAFFYAHAAQNIGEALDLIEQLLKSKPANLTGFALPQDGRFAAAAALHLQIETVVGQVHFAADEPLRPRLVPFQNLRPRLEPMQFIRRRCPEFFRILNRTLVQGLVIFQTADVGLRYKLLRRGYHAKFVQ